MRPPPPLSKEEEERLKEKAKHCETCEEWHDECDVVCCRYFKVPAPLGKTVKKGEAFWIREMRQIILQYYKAKGYKVSRHNVKITPTDSEQIGRMVHVYDDCPQLKDGKCCLQDEVKPKLCRDFTGEPDLLWLIPTRCLFRFKKQFL